jgi:hypothetical protein
MRLSTIKRYMTETYSNSYFPYRKHVCFQQGVLIDLGNDHDNFGKASESTEACASSIPVSDLSSIDQLPETVCPSS